MPWQDRIREAAYTSPSGNRIVFQYGDVENSFEKLGAAYEFPDAPGTYMQDLGHSGRRYPLVVYFSGDNYDLQAEIFDAMLRERGPGRLEHPMYGVADVVPFGEIRRRDDLVTAANQAAIQLTFWATTGLVYPTNRTDAASDVIRAVLAYNQASAEQFAASVDLGTPSALAGLTGDYLDALGEARSQLQGVTESSQAVQRQFTTIERAIIENMDALVGDPLTLALQTALFVQSPGRATARIGSRLDAYAATIALLTGDIETPGYGPRNANRFKARELFAMGAASGQVVSVVNAQFVTKGDAVQAADVLLSQLDNVTNWREANYAALGEIDTGEAYAELQAATALAAGYLVEISFTLRQERIITLDRRRNLVELCVELYGRIDDETLDFFITSNTLTGSEILELPRGRQIAYYV